MSGLVVVGIDGSPPVGPWPGRRRRPRLRHARLRVVLAWSYLDQPGGGAFDPSFGEDDARRLLEEAMAGLGREAEGIDVEPVAVNDLPARGLLEAAGPDPDLLVVGARGGGGFRGLLLGSVSQQVAQHAPCPVVIVPVKGGR